MRNKTAIANLSGSYPSSLAPQTEAHIWREWARNAREVVADNLSDCGGAFLSNAIRKSWGFDPYKQEFYFTVEYNLDVDVQGERIIGTLTRTFELSPTKPLVDEIARLKAALTSWIKAARTVRSHAPTLAQ